MILKQATNGDYYLSRVSALGYTKKLIKKVYKERRYRNWWLVKHCSRSNSGEIQFGSRTSNVSLMIPEEFIGKRVRFKLEVIED